MTGPFLNMSQERYRCADCGHRGPALLEETVQYHGRNARETIVEPICHKCGSPNISVIEEE